MKKSLVYCGVMFSLFLVLAMAAYDGGGYGTHVRSYRFLHNTISDLGCLRGIGGRPVAASVVLFGLACLHGAVFLVLAYGWQRPRGLVYAPRVILGWLAGLSLVGVAAFPGDVWPLAHGVAATATLSALAGALAVSAFERRAPRYALWSLVLALYALFPGVWRPWLSIVAGQKLVVCGAVACMGYEWLRAKVAKSGRAQVHSLATLHV